MNTSSSLQTPLLFLCPPSLKKENNPSSSPSLKHKNYLSPSIPTPRPSHFSTWALNIICTLTTQIFFFSPDSPLNVFPVCPPVYLTSPHGYLKGVSDLTYPIPAPDLPSTNLVLGQSSPSQQMSTAFSQLDGPHILDLPLTPLAVGSI